MESASRPIVFLHGSASDETSLLTLSAQIGTDHPSYFPRGKERSEGAYTFYRRLEDRSIDFENLAARSAELAGFLSNIAGSHGRRPIVIGYSSGAVTAAALLAKHAEFVEGAVLFRPERPYGASPFPRLDNRPVLLISGSQDIRRKRSDAPALLNLLRAAGANVEWHDLPCGHTLDPDGADIELTRAWLAKRG